MGGGEVGQAPARSKRMSVPSLRAQEATADAVRSPEKKKSKVAKNDKVPKGSIPSKEERVSQPPAADDLRADLASTREAAAAAGMRSLDKKKKNHATKKAPLQAPVLSTEPQHNLAPPAGDAEIDAEGTCDAIKSPGRGDSGLGSQKTGALASEAGTKRPEPSKVLPSGTTCDAPQSEGTSGLSPGECSSGVRGHAHV